MVLEDFWRLSSPGGMGNGNWNWNWKSLLTCSMILAHDACVLRVFGQADTARWLQMWEAATAIWSMCVRGAKGGSVTGLGGSSSFIAALTSSEMMGRLMDE